MILTCPRCGEKTGGIMRLCKRCKQSVSLLTEPKAPKRPIKEDDE